MEAIKQNARSKESFPILRQIDISGIGKYNKVGQLSLETLNFFIYYFILRVHIN